MKQLFVSLAMVAIVFIIIIGAVFIVVKNDIEEWNNGYCECGGAWKIQGFHYEGQRHNTKYYDYQCDSCGKYIDCLNQMEIEHK